MSLDLQDASMSHFWYSSKSDQPTPKILYAYYYCFPTGCFKNISALCIIDFFYLYMVQAKQDIVRTIDDVLPEKDKGVLLAVLYLCSYISL